MKMSPSAPGRTILVAAFLVLVAGFPSLAHAQAVCGDGIVTPPEVCDPAGFFTVCNAQSGGQQQGHGTGTDGEGQTGFGNSGYKECFPSCQGFSACVASAPFFQAGDYFSLSGAYFPTFTVDATQNRTIFINLKDFRTVRDKVHIDVTVYDDKGVAVPNHSFEITVPTTSPTLLTYNVDPTFTLETGKTYSAKLQIDTTGSSLPAAEKVIGNNTATVYFTAIQPARDIAVPDNSPWASFLVAGGALGFLFFARNKN